MATPDITAQIARIIQGTPQGQELAPSLDSARQSRSRIDELSEPLERPERVERESLTTRERVLGTLSNVLSRYASGINPNIEFLDQITKLVESKQEEADRENQQVDLEFSDLREQRTASLGLAERDLDRSREDTRRISERQITTGEQRTKAAAREAEIAGGERHDREMEALRTENDRELIRLRDTLEKNRSEIDRDIAGDGVGLANRWFEGFVNPDTGQAVLSMKERILEAVKDGTPIAQVFQEIKTEHSRAFDERIPNKGERAAAEEALIKRFNDALIAASAELTVGPPAPGPGPVPKPGGSKKGGLLGDIRGSTPR